MSKKLQRLNQEEEERQVMGMSGCRRCVFYAEFLALLVAEGRDSD